MSDQINVANPPRANIFLMFRAHSHRHFPANARAFAVGSVMVEWPGGIVAMLSQVTANSTISASRRVQLVRLRSDEFGCAADHGAAYATSDKNAPVIKHGGGMILSRLRHCAKESELSS
jgi:hypothetical protein